jgi:Protein of unknown function (DUF1549)/Protein of unknown function (DUF1553)
MSHFLFAILATHVLAAPAMPAEAPSFRNDVMAVLSRSGCNQGACHGNLNGKGGFKLSLRGEDPNFDLSVLTRDFLGRRLSPIRPEESLLLRKATGFIAHEGGPRFGAQSIEYRIMRDWIAAGCPADAANQRVISRIEVTPSRQILVYPENRFRIAVKGFYSDGTSRDLSRLAVYEPSTAGNVSVAPDGEASMDRPGELVVIVRYLDRQAPVSVAFIPAREGFAWKDVPLGSPIDRILFERMKSLRLTPSDRCCDSAFIRRAFLDALGVLPSVEETTTFLADGRSDKRTRLIDGLLNRPEFADHWAQKWSDLLRNEEKSLDRKGVRVFYQWLRDSIAHDKPLNELAREVIAGRGSTYQNPPANFYRALREPYGRAEAVAQVFLGTRIGCAKCHNHPFDRWKQNDYHDFAALFGTIDYRILSNNRGDKLDTHEFDGEQIVLTTRDSDMLHPRSGTPLKPRLLGETAALADGVDRLQVLADWVADPKNPFFARAQANRVWYHLLGKGLVDPIDDFRSTNPAVTAELLDYLSQRLAASSFNLRSLVGEIMNSRTYQLSSDDAGTNHDDDMHFSKALIGPLEAEQLLDAVCNVLDTPVKFNGYPTGYRAGEIAAMPQGRRGEKRKEMGEKFLKVFGKPDRLLTCECERSEDTGVLQSFQLLTGELLHSLLDRTDNRIGQLLTEKKSNSKIIETFYLAALSRYPTKTEIERLTAFVGKATNRREALEDVVWGLVNSKEFLLRR